MTLGASWPVPANWGRPVALSVGTRPLILTQSGVGRVGELENTFQPIPVEELVLFPDMTGGDSSPSLGDLVAVDLNDDMRDDLVLAVFGAGPERESDVRVRSRVFVLPGIDGDAFDLEAAFEVGGAANAHHVVRGRGGLFSASERYVEHLPQVCR